MLFQKHVAANSGCCAGQEREDARAATMAQRMTKEWLRKRCKELDLYTTPSLNEKLYLNFQGFSEIENLEEYTGLKSIFLEGNCLDSLKGLQKCKDLKCLFVQQNSIQEISHLEELEELCHLNVSSNRLTSLANLENLGKLDTLLAANNRYGHARRNFIPPCRKAMTDDEGVCIFLPVSSQALLRGVPGPLEGLSLYNGARRAAQQDRGRGDSRGA